MKTIKESGRSQKLIVKKSIFICTIITVQSKEEALSQLHKIKQEFRKATHNAYACRIGNPVNWEESSDDGEVKGTAGLPIMKILRSRDITNILVVVTRFYGGIKLGPGGLIKSYSASATNLIDAIGVKELEI